MSQIFANFGTPNINGATLLRVYSNRVKDNIFQGIFTRPNEACTEKYSEDTNAAEINVTRIVPNGIPARELGASTNGGWFNSRTASTPATADYGVRIIKQIDDNVDIPFVQQDMMNVDVAEGELKNLFGKVDREVNACTMAASTYKVLYENYTNSKGHIVTMASSPVAGDYLGAVLDANAYLDEGNQDIGIDTYPRDQRAILLRGEMNRALKSDIKTDSNYGQILVKTGALDVDTKLESVSQFLGIVDNTPCYLVSPIVWTYMENYLGVALGSLDKVLALVVSATGTLRGLAFTDTVTMIPGPNGPSTRLQPKFRFGAECIDEYSVVPIVKYGFSNPVTATTNAPKAIDSRTYTITYVANATLASGAVPAASTGNIYLSTLTVAGNTGSMAVTDKTFGGWNTKADGSGTAYAAGSSFQIKGSTSLYAVWTT